MTRGLDRHSRLWRLLVAALFALFVLAGCGLDEEARAPTARSSFPIDGLYPRFDPAERRYVSRCGRGAAPIHAVAGDGIKVEVDSGLPETGAFSIDPGVPPGEDFEIAITDGNHRDLYEVRCLPADFPAWRFERLRETAPACSWLASEPSERPGHG